MTLQQWTGHTPPTPDEAAAATSAIERELGDRYRVDRFLGRGAFATVWLAQDTATGRPVAVKRFIPRQTERRRFYRELRVMLALDHPNLVRLISLVERDGVRLLLLEYCAGGSLRRALSRARQEGTRCPLNRVVELGVDMLAGLRACHKADVLHRDVKPENLLFEAPVDGFGPSCLKLSDFGLSQSTERSEPDGRLQALSGSPAYMAPENFAGEMSVASDIYSVGIVLYELLHQRLPFVGPPAELARQHHRVEPVVSASLPEPLEALVREMLRKQPEQRPTSDALLERLRALGEAPLTRRLVPSQRRLTRRHRTLVGDPKRPTALCLAEGELRVLPLDGEPTPRMAAQPAGLRLLATAPDGSAWGCSSERRACVVLGPEDTQLEWHGAHPALAGATAFAPISPERWAVVSAGALLIIDGETTQLRMPLPTGFKPKLCALRGGGLAVADGGRHSRLFLFGARSYLTHMLTLPGGCWQLARAGADLVVRVLTDGDFRWWRVAARDGARSPLAFAGDVVDVAEHEGRLVGLRRDGVVVDLEGSTVTTFAGDLEFRRLLVAGPWFAAVGGDSASDWLMTQPASAAKGPRIAAPTPALPLERVDPTIPNSPSFTALTATNDPAPEEATT